jgi:hypothetical protein
MSPCAGFPTTRKIDGLTVAFAGILFVSIVLRIYIASSGGHFYWPDEGRIRASLAAAQAILQGDILAGFRFDKMGIDHLGFKIIATLPVLADVRAGTNYAVASVFFSLISAGNIALVACIAQRLGWTRRQAVLSAFCMAASSSGLYWARHFMPYDLAMMFALAALYCALGTSKSGRDYFLTGLFSALAFITYNGYWTMGLLALLLCCIKSPDRLRRSPRLVWLYSVGFGSILLGTLLLTGRTIPGLVHDYLSFSKSIDQGDFSEGYIFILKYFWVSEKFLLVFWLVSLAACLKIYADERSRSLGMLLFCVLFLYCVLAILSTGVHVFVLYGRICRQFIPFCSLLAAYFLSYAGVGGLRQVGRTVAVLTAVSAIALLNFTPIVRQRFPADFREYVAKHHPEATGEGYAFVNAQYFYPAPSAGPDRVIADVLERTPHPLQYKPYQFEGYTRSERERIDKTDVAMKFVALGRW